jgi:hypothetical protein
MSEESLVSPVRKTGPQPAEHRPARKGYVYPELKVYGKMWELTAGGTGPVSELEVVLPEDARICLDAEPGTCRL